MKQQATEFLKKDIAILLQKHSEEVAKDEIGSAINIMKDIDFALSQLKKLDDIEIEVKEVQTDNSILGWYDVLKFFIDTKQSQLIKLDYSNKDNERKHRGTGKTTALLMASHEYRIPLLTNSILKSELDESAKRLGIYPIIIYDRKYLTSPQYKSSIVLVDEHSNYRDINIQKVIIGFQPLSNK